VSPSRLLLANLNGVIVLLSLWFAAAQTFALLIPDSGIPRLAFNLYFLLLVVNTAAAAPDRRRLLRSLAVTFGTAFVLKFVVLEQLSAPGSGWLKRVLQAMLEGITLGALTQAVVHPAMGYVALVSLGLFLVGVFLLPHRQLPGASGLAVRDERVREI